MELIEFGTMPTHHPWEYDQILRVKELLIQGLGNQEPWTVLVYNVPISHKAGNRIENDVDWDGQIDIVLLTAHRIVIYEVKSFTADILEASTNNKPWLIQRRNGSGKERHRSYFDQVSQQRAFLLTDVLMSDQFQIQHNPDGFQHFVVDARLVFKDETRFDGFYYDVPKDMKPEQFETEILSQITKEEDREFLKQCYSNIDSYGKKRIVGKIPKYRERLLEIFSQYGITIRTSKFFRMIHENDIPEDLTKTGSEKFLLSLEAAQHLGQFLTKYHL